MLNNSILIGRTVREPEIYGNEKKVAKITIAVDDGFGDNKRTDYIPVTAFGKTAEFCEKFLRKGTLIAVEGKIRTGVYEKKDGTKAKTFEVVSENLKVLERRDRTEKEAPEGFARVDEDCPF